MNKHMIRASIVGAATVACALLASPLYAQATPEKMDLTAYYRAPATLGLTYLPLSGIGNRTLADFDVYELSGQLTASPSFAPGLQPFATGGVLGYTFLGDIDEVRQDWTHTHVFAGLGLGLASRFSREFEVGFRLFGAGSLSYFSELTLDGVTGPLGQYNILGGASARLALNPSYKLSIEAEPAVRYVFALGPQTDYNGFTFGVGFGARYRFGQDPDAPQTAVRAIRFEKAAMPAVFAAMRSYYAKKPAGTISITNTERFALTDVRASFMQAGFMDSPTPCTTIAELAPGQTAQIPILALYNDEVFSTQGVTAVTGEIIVQYGARGKPVEQRQSVTYDLYDKNALTWDDDRKVAAFITTQDSALRNYASHIRQVHRANVNEYLSRNLQFAMQAYGALAELGMYYQVDPTSPFTQAQESALLVDSISLPRETLTRRTGDCDDLTVLYSALLQTVGIPTALVTIPGHIYSAFNTGVATKDYRSMHPDRNMFLDVGGELWVLVEITLIGSADFLKAWNVGVTEFRKYDGDTKARGFFPVAEAQELYRPVPLRETDLGLQYGDDSALQARFAADMDRLAATILSPGADKARASGLARDWNAYGAAAAQLGALGQARSAFEQSLKIDPSNASARINMGSVLYLERKYTDALAAFEAARRSLESKGTGSKTIRANVLINLAKTHHALGNYDQAGASYRDASALSPELASRFDYLASAGTIATGSSAGATGGGAAGSRTSPGTASAATGVASTGSVTATAGTDGGRASQSATAEPILFVDE